MATPSTEPSGGSVQVIAEAGVNHNGSVAVAHELIDIAATARADAVKFQTFIGERLVAQDAPTVRYQQERTGTASQLEMVKALELPRTAWAELKAHADEAGLSFLSTAFDVESADLLDDLGVTQFKVPSGEITNLPFIVDLAARGRPLIISTGAATMAEVRLAVDAAAAAPSITLLHCVSSYPATISSANLLSIPALRDDLGHPVGWSDHTLGSLTAIAAVALGATVLEKHITADHGQAGPDHVASADPLEFNAYVADVRAAESALGTYGKAPAAEEEEVRLLARRSWHAARDLESGTRLAVEDVVALRPAVGIPPTEPIEGRVLVVDVRRGAPLTPEHLEADER